MKKLFYVTGGVFGILFFSISFFMLIQKNNLPFNWIAIGDQSWLVSFIERKISTSDRQIRLHNVRGVFSSQLSVETVTVSDRKGTWLEITHAKIDWNRLALFKGMIDINKLSAERIAFLRKPQKSSSSSLFKFSDFSIPNVPLPISISEFIAERVIFKHSFFGLFADMSLKGRVSLNMDGFDADVVARRLDAPGHLSILTKISKSSRIAQVNINVDEPKNGILAHILSIEGYPELNFAMEGNGNFDDLVVKVLLETNRQSILDGKIIFTGTEEGHHLSAQLDGMIILLMPLQYRDFFDPDIKLKAEMVMTKEGVMRLDQMVIQGERINVTSHAEVASDGFLRRLFVNGNMKFNENRESAHLLSSEIEYADNLALTIDYGREGEQTWKGQLRFHNLGNKNIYIRDAVFDMGGVSENLDDVGSRHVGIQVGGVLQGVRNTESMMTNDLDQTIHVHVDADILAGKSISIHNFDINAQDFSVWLKGKIDNFIFKGDLGLKAQNLVPLGFLSSRPLSGGADIEAKGTVNLVNNFFNLKLSGMVDNLTVGTTIVDHLLRGNLTFSGAVIQDVAGVTVRNLNLNNQYASLKANGYYSDMNAEMDFSARVSDISMLDSRMDGAVAIKGTVRGSNGPIEINTRIHASEAFLIEKKLQEMTFNIHTFVDNTSPEIPHFTGFIKGEGILAEKPLKLSVSFNNSEHFWKFQDINIKGGDAEITGDFARTFEGFLEGSLHVDADDITIFSALLLQDGRGSVKGDFLFNEQNSKQRVNLKADVDQFIFASNEIGKLNISADIFNPFKAIEFEGFVDAEKIQTPLIKINHLTVRANNNDGQTAFNIQSVLHDDINAQLSGFVVTKGLQLGVRQQVWLETVDVKKSDFHATLLKSAAIIFGEEKVIVSELGFSVNDGRIIFAGDFQDIFNLHITMNAMPVDLANLWKPDLGATGELEGKITIRGHLENFDITYDVEGKGLTIASFQKVTEPFTLHTSGKMVDNVLTVDASLKGGGGQMQAQGDISLNTHELDLHIDLKNFPARLANVFIKRQVPEGVIGGKINVGGMLNNPSVYFELSGQNLTIDKGVVSANVDIRGLYEQSMFRIEHMIAKGSKELNLAAKGSISLKDTNVELNVEGTMPLVFMDQFLAERGAHIAGIAKINAAVSGALSQPQLVGQFSVVDGSFIDTQTNLGLRNVTLKGVLNGDHMVLEYAHALALGGGDISASGRIFNNLQTDLVLHLDHANYNNGSMIFATLMGDMTVSGHFLQNLVIGGDITVEKAEILIPNHFQSTIFLNIKHESLTQSIQKTLEYANIEIDSHARAISEKPPSIVRLNVQVNARNQFFVRGRGLDAELGGHINLTGSLDDMHPVGELRMIRGRFDILSQRLSFDTGQVNFNGNLNPTIYFIVNSDSGDISVTVKVSGTFDNLDIQFTSQPILPQDEVLARLIFKRSLNELSPFQIAQLAAAVAELAGAANASLLSALREKIGLDDLDVIIDENGNTGLRIGRYIRDNVYLGLETGSDKTAKGMVNLDISRYLKAKSVIGTEENSNFGLFYEKDY
ncbi:translocation/assembly module TamB domain-containing protein [Bartonella ancashensis]|uniref:Gramicidin S biosynthesis GrsT protein n=1 Tax=Bartonella ancashensis TaxID=1318743 RepID=A0A0M4LG40_9HYPH|nr:translocation/assembly module TamB domain-containing protein [Bartonella ancashensis]ALE03307.1 gramicidin S biosynthesis GrsT protein [Bartonella ancashensis]